MKVIASLAALGVAAYALLVFIGGGEGSVSKDPGHEGEDDFEDD